MLLRENRRSSKTGSLCRAHDDAAPVTLGDLVGGKRGLDIIEAEPALSAIVFPLGVIATVAPGAARIVADLSSPPNPPKAREKVGKTSLITGPGSVMSLFLVLNRTYLFRRHSELVTRYEKGILTMIFFIAIKFRTRELGRDA